LKFNFSLITIVSLLIIVVPPVFAIYLPSIENDLNLVDLKVVDLQILSMDDTPWEYLDNADLVKITINVTNNGLDYLLLDNKMLILWAMEPDYRKSSSDNEILELVDNYSTIYDDELEVIYENLESRELFDECDHIHERIRIGQSKVFTICYNVLRIWHNEVLTIDGQKQYYIVMMDNQYASSCPNCKKIPLSTISVPTTKYYTPRWVQNLFEWNQRGIISDQEFEYSIKYLVTRGIISKENEKMQPTTMENKNLQLKEHQARLSLAQQNNLYVSAMNFYESKYNDSFSGVVCKKQNNIVTLSGDYTNDGSDYQAVFLKLLIFDDLGNVVDAGIAKIVDVTQNDFRHFSVSTPYKGKINSCLVMIDSRFPQE